MKDYKWEMHPDTIFEAKRMSNGKWVRGQVIGEQPFVYILTHENYKEATIEDFGKNKCHAKVELIRVIGASVRKVDRFARLSIPEDNNNTIFGVGDIVRGKCADGFEFDGRIFRVDIQREGEKLRTIMFVTQLADTKVMPFGHVAVFLDDVTEFEILRFKEEEPATLLEG